MLAGPFSAHTIWIWSAGTPLPNCSPVREFFAFLRNLLSLMAKACKTSLMRRVECVSASNSAACQFDFCHTYWAGTGSLHIVVAAAATAPPRSDPRENSLMDFSPLDVLARRVRALLGRVSCPQYFRLAISYAGLSGSSTQLSGGVT